MDCCIPFAYETNHDIQFKGGEMLRFLRGASFLLPGRGREKAPTLSKSWLVNKMPSHVGMVTPVCRLTNYLS